MPDLLILLVFLSVLKRIVFLYLQAFIALILYHFGEEKFFVWKYLLSLKVVVQISSLKHSLFSILCMSIVYLKCLLQKRSSQHSMLPRKFAFLLENRYENYLCRKIISRWLNMRTLLLFPILLSSRFFFAGHCKPNAAFCAWKL